MVRDLCCVVIISILIIIIIITIIILLLLLLLLYKRKINLEREYFLCEMIRPVRVLGNTPKPPQTTSKPIQTTFLTHRICFCDSINN